MKKDRIKYFNLLMELANEKSILLISLIHGIDREIIFSEGEVSKIDTMNRVLERENSSSAIIKRKGPNTELAVFGVAFLKNAPFHCDANNDQYGQDFNLLILTYMALLFLNLKMNDNDVHREYIKLYNKISFQDLQKVFVHWSNTYK